MITTPFPFMTLMVLIPGVILYIYKKYKLKLFHYLPPMMLIFLSSMGLYTLGLWEMSDSISVTRNNLRNNLIPLMIFLMSLQCDVRKILGLGPRLIGIFISATASLTLGYITVFFIFSPFLGDEIASTFGAMLAGWTGGTQNFLAVKKALSISDDIMAHTLLMGSINYSIWVLFLVGLKPLKNKFNFWTKANVSSIESIGTKLVITGENKKIDYIDLLYILGLGMLVSVIFSWLGTYLGDTLKIFFASSIWTIILATILGLILAPTRVAKIAGVAEIANMGLYIILFLVSANVNLKELIEAPFYVLAGIFILLIHGVCMIVFAKLFKWDLFSCGVASLANIGGITSAPVLAAGYDKSWVSISILMSMLGVILGTFVGLGVGTLLQNFTP